jgi:hypothetical protein
MMLGTFDATPLTLDDSFDPKNVARDSNVEHDTKNHYRLNARRG